MVVILLYSSETVATKMQTITKSSGIALLLRIIGDEYIIVYNIFLNV